MYAGFVKGEVHRKEQVSADHFHRIATLKGVNDVTVDRNWYISNKIVAKRTIKKNRDPNTRRNHLP